MPVFDFCNDTDAIVEVLDQFHGCTVALSTDPNILWDTRRRLDDFDVLWRDEVGAAMPALLGAGSSDDMRSAETYAVWARRRPGSSRWATSNALSSVTPEQVRPHVLVPLPDRRLHPPSQVLDTSHWPDQQASSVRGT